MTNEYRKKIKERMSKNPENPGNPKVPFGLERFTAIEPFTKLTTKEQAKEYAKIIKDLMKKYGISEDLKQEFREKSGLPGLRIAIVSGARPAEKKGYFALEGARYIWEENMMELYPAVVGTETLLHEFYHYIQHVEHVTGRIKHTIYPDKVERIAKKVERGEKITRKEEADALEPGAEEFVRKETFI